MALTITMILHIRFTYQVFQCHQPV